MTAVDHYDSPIPLYHRIELVITQRIRDGSYGAGERLPTEDTFVREFGVSRATVRQALDQLERRALIYRRQGRGSFVADKLPRMFSLRVQGSLADLTRQTDRTYADSIFIQRDVELPLSFASALAVADRKGTIVRRRRLLDGKPFAYTVNYLPERFGALLSKRILQKNSLMHTLEEAGVEWSHALQVVRAEVADPALQEQLTIPLGAPLLYAERLMFAVPDLPVEVVQTWYRGDMYEYAVALDARQSPHGEFSSTLA